MKKEFNKSKTVEIFDAKGRPHQIEISNIHSIEKYEGDEDSCLAIVVLKDSGLFYASQKPYEIAGLINGEPDRATVQQWEREIVERRQSDASQRLEGLEQEYAQKKQDEDRSFEEKQGSVAEWIERLTLSIFVRQLKIEDTFSLRMAQACFRKARKGHENAVMARIYDTIGRKLAGNDVNLFSQVSVQRGELSLAERQADNLARDREMSQRNRDATYLREVAWLETMAKDPEMSHQDRGVLQAKITEYRREHAAPDFKFVRDPAGNYRNERDVGRERFERIRDNVARDEGMSLGRRRGLGYER